MEQVDAETATCEVSMLDLRTGKMAQWIKHLCKGEDQGSDPRTHITVGWTWWPTWSQGLEGKNRRSYEQASYNCELYIQLRYPASVTRLMRYNCRPV